MVNKIRERNFDYGFGEVQTTAYKNFHFRYEVEILETAIENAKGCEALESYNIT